MVSREGRLIVAVIGDKNVGPPVSIEIGDNELTGVNRSGPRTGNYLRCTVDVRASGLTKSDDYGQPRRGAADRSKGHVWNAVTIEVPVTNGISIGTRVSNRRETGMTVDCVWNL